MKKILLLLSLLFFCGIVQANATPKDRSGRVAKNGQYKKKKGFMWGLFKKRNDCDCPKH
jgi:hypothetical protein